ncbi:monodehydroascorbate reductase 1 [Striga asiatica]|uniref:Monodehydroascorbate reductase 1 n=1 Tax=Striga asiatica TaxID=4170 RepID=A0A5A7QM25_STRAF|nr:monodehydroascorbate reductase 1 [Striga asiatica]
MKVKAGGAQIHNRAAIAVGIRHENCATRDTSYVAPDEKPGLPEFGRRRHSPDTQQIRAYLPIDGENEGIGVVGNRSNPSSPNPKIGDENLISTDTTPPIDNPAIC